MFSVLALLLLLVALVWLSRAIARISDLEQKQAASERILQSLLQRLYRLETAAEPPKPQPAAPAPPTPEPVVQLGEQPLVEVAEAPPVPGEEPLPPPMPAVEPAPQPAVAAAVSENWEARLGGSWLNKLGVLVLVVGIALFLGYSLTNMGPVARVSVGYLVSLSLLGCGIAAERQPAWRMYAYGLIGGGWAAVYLTTYAAHALPAARLIDDATVAMIALLLVAAGMILHSLRYQSQVVTGVAYFVAFITLTLQPASLFARVASIPLAASALYVAHRFGWVSLQIAAIALSYGAYALGDHPDNLFHAWIAGRPVLWIYWLMFEAFELAGARLRGRAPALFLLNATGFLAATFLARPELDAENIDLFLPVAAVVFLASAVLHARLGSAGEQPPAAAGYEAPVTVSAILVAATIFRRFSGVYLTLGLLAEAQMLVLAGLQLRSAYLRSMGGLLFFIPFFRIVSGDLDQPALRAIGSAAAAVFYVNRWLLRRLDSAWMIPIYSYGGSVLAAVLIGEILPREYRAAGWLAAALVLLEAGLFTRLAELRFQAAGFTVLSLAILPFILDWGYGRAWLSLGIPVLLSYAASTRLTQVASNRITLLERRIALGVAFTTGTAFLTALLWAVLPRVAVAPAWAALALVLLFIGVRLDEIGSRLQAAALALAAFVNVWAVHFDGPGGFKLRLLPVASTVALLYAAEFVVPRNPSSLIDRLARPGYSILGTVLLAALLGHEVSGRLLTVAWGLQGVVLLVAGFVAAERVLRISGLALFLFCILKLFVYDLRELDTLSRILSFIVLGLLLLGASWIYTRFREQFRRYL